MRIPRVGILLPALNEERSLPRVLDGLRALPCEAAGASGSRLPFALETPVVVDNGSTDRTAAVAREGGAQVVPESRRGYGRACLTGLATMGARGADRPDVVVFLDADASDDPGRLPRLLAPLLEGTADLVLGSRRLGECEPGALMPQARFGNDLCVALIRLLYRFRYTDLGPFRAVTWEALERLEMADSGFGWTAEMQVKALRAGLRVREISVPYRPRIGTSKISGTLSGTIQAGAKILWTIARLRRWRPAQGARTASRACEPS